MCSVFEIIDLCIVLMWKKTICSEYDFEYWVTIETGNGEIYYMPMVGHHELEDGRIIDDVVADMYRAG